MGLVQRAIEEAGFSTITLSSMWAVTAAVSPPRLAAIEAPNGLPLGLPHDMERHTAVLEATLQALAETSKPGTVTPLPFTWPQDLEVENHPEEAPPIVQAIKRRPWLYRKLLKGDIPNPD